MTPAATTDTQTARAAVLLAADEVFYRGGIGSSSMAAIRDRSGVSLRRLYGLYPSKRDLVHAWLRARHESWLAWFSGAVAEGLARGLAPADAVFDALAAWASSPGYRGCAFLNAAAESAELDDEVGRIVADHKRAVITYLESILAGAGRADSAELAPQLAVLADGAIVQAAVFASPAPVEVARTTARRLLR